MAVLYEYKDYPTHGVAQPLGDSLDKTRQRFAWQLANQIANGEPIVLGWESVPYSTASPEDLDQPDYWLITHNSDGRQYKLELTYSSGYITQIVIRYHNGVDSPASLDIVDKGTVTIARNGAGTITGITTA